MYDYDIVCIGGGPGGSACAMRSADRGKKVAIIEARLKNGSGGTCVNRGCIPTKALMASTNLYASLKEAKAYGINIDMSAVTVDFKAIDKRRKGVINNLGFGLETLLWKKSRGIDVIKGRARLVDAHTIEVDNGKEKKTVTAEYINIAVGSEPAEIPAFHVDHQKVITSNEIMDFSRPMPKSIVIIGSGAIGLEYAHIYNTFDIPVTIVEMMPNLVPALHEPEITDAVRKSLEKRGIVVKTGSGIANVEVQPDGRVKSTLANGEELISDEVLCAIGRTLNTRDRQMHYFYGARALNEVFYLEDFQQLEKDFPNFHFHLALDRPDPAADAAGVKYTAGFVHQVMYNTYLKDHDAPEDIEYYMCGPGPMSKAVVGMLDSLGVEPESIMYDNFGG